MTLRAWRLQTLMVCSLFSYGAGAMAQDVWSPGRIIGDINEMTGVHEKVPKAPAFVTKTHRPEWELDYQPLMPTQSESPPNVSATANAAGQELDAARAVNENMAKSVPAPITQKKSPSKTPKAMDPFEGLDGASTN
jgi:hypothetical protein